MFVCLFVSVHAAVRHNHCQVVELLVSRTLSKLDLSNVSGATYLTLAAALGRIEICRLVATEQNLFKADCLGLTPMHHAVRNNHPEVIGILCRRVARLRHKSSMGDRMAKRISVSDMFLESGTRRRRTNTHNKRHGSLENDEQDVPKRALTAIQRISRIFNKSRETDSLLEMNESSGYIPGMLNTGQVESNLLNREAGEVEAHASPLHLAVRYGHVECVRELLKGGADPSQRDATGFTPYKTALWQNHLARASEIKHTKDEYRRSHRTKPRRSSGGGLTKSETEDASHDVNDDVPEPTTEQTADILKAIIQNPKIASRRKLFAFKRFYQDFILPFLIALIFLMLTLPKSSATYLVGRWADNTVVTADLDTYTNFDDVYDWMEGRFQNLSTLFPPTHEERVTTNGLQVLGPIRIRQQKSIANNSGVFPLLNVSRFEKRLPHRYTTGNEDHDYFPPGTFQQKTSLADCAGLWNEHGNNPWVYRKSNTSGLDVDNFGDYGGGGYVVDLTVLNQHDGSDNAAMINCLRVSNWVDQYTRVVIVDMPVLNMNMGTFTGIHFWFSFGMTGELVMSDQSLSHSLGFGLHDKLKVSLERFDYPGWGMQVVVAFQTASIFVSICTRYLRNNRRVGWNFFGHMRALINRNNLYDLVLVVLLLALFSLDVIAYRRRRDLFGPEFRVVQDSYIDLYDLLRMVNTETAILAAVTIMVWLRMLVFCTRLPTIGPLTIAIFSTFQSKSVRTFLFLLGYIVLGFAFAFRVMLAQLSFCRDYYHTFVQLAQLVVQQWNSALYEIVRGSVGKSLVLILFMLSTALIYMNLLISVLSSVYPTEKARAEQEYDDSITEATQEEYMKRSNPILRTPTSNIFMRTFHNIFVRPIVEPIAVFAALLGYHKGTQNKENFGWERGKSAKCRNLVVDALLSDQPKQISHEEEEDEEML
eukprot:c20474_g1_i1.p1 GENE.c20474_g1_i1~~c20474_g1_i1.p1  ORF type:complete len:995 (-),score=262.19 c20474_g1_i1:909-3701(-)